MKPFCYADASPYGVLVNYEDAQQFAEDEWVIVEGTIQKTMFNDFDIIEVYVDSVENTLEPISPYAYPNYEFELK